MITAVRNSLYIAWRYLAYHRLRTAVLVVALAIILFVPAFLATIIDEGRRQLTARADATPLLLGAPGSALDLVMSSLYFTRDLPRLITFGDAETIDDTGYATTIPLDTRHSAGAFTIVGTTLEYFDYRGLKIARGRPLAVLGDAVVGANAAAALGLDPGDSIISTPDTVFDIAGRYPLKVSIVGVLGPTGTRDDDAIFVDIRTGWIIDGIGHGHLDLLRSDDPTVVLKRDDGAIVANAKLETYTVITPDNLADFHFHGAVRGYPVTAAIVVPEDTRAAAILLGRYQAAEAGLQLMRPEVVVRDLVRTIFRIKRIFDLVVITVGAATLLAVALVILLSLRLRAGELSTIYRLGCSRGAAAGFVAAELAIIAGLSFTWAGVLLFVTALYRDALFFRILS